MFIGCLISYPNKLDKIRNSITLEVRNHVKVILVTLLVEDVIGFGLVLKF
jgi:hypothetical protein